MTQVRHENCAHQLVIGKRSRTVAAFTHARSEPEPQLKDIEVHSRTSIPDTQ